MHKMSAEHFISQLYRESSLVSLEDFPIWALNLLRQVISFDGAIWATGHLSTKEFHTQTLIDVPPKILTQLQKHLTINPIFEKLLLTEGNAVDMSEVLSDEHFYQSPLYHQCFKPFNIERILSSIHIDERSGIFTLLTLYRYDRQHCFTAEEKNTQNRLLYHLLCAASHRQFIALNEQPGELLNKQSSNIASAICDGEGIYHCVESNFLDILEQHLTAVSGQKFPLPISAEQTEFSIDNLQFNQTKLGDLYRLSVRIKNQLDKLSSREKQVVAGICQGSTFKQIARELQLSPSTVSNHLYRIYMKLNIHTRSELVVIAKQSDFNSTS